MKSIIALTVAAFTLASCGGGGALGPTSRDVGILPSGFVATLDDATSEVVLTIDGVEVARLLSGLGPTAFTRYTGGGAEVLYGETISGAGAVFVASSPTVNLGLAGVQVARLGETDLPSSGSATFNGDYVGRLILSTDLSVSEGVTGDAQLTADFASASISGNITNRSFTNGGSVDLMLLPTAITSAGAFSGTTTGGNTFGLGSASDGTYVGLIVGATGNEVVGGVSVVHISGPNTFIEIGGFVAAE